LRRAGCARETGLGRCGSNSPANDAWPTGRAARQRSRVRARATSAGGACNALVSGSHARRSPRSSRPAARTCGATRRGSQAARCTNGSGCRGSPSRSAVSGYRCAEGTGRAELIAEQKRTVGLNTGAMAIGTSALLSGQGTPTLASVGIDRRRLKGTAWCSILLPGSAGVGRPRWFTGSEFSPPAVERGAKGDALRPKWG